jgi:copper resistance protein C
LRKAAPRGRDKIFEMVSRARRVAGLLVLVFPLVAAWSSVAPGHSLPERFEPRGDAPIRSAPSEVRIVFGGDIEPAFSTIEVTDSTARRVDKGDARVDDRNRRLLRVSLRALGPGAYRVAWRVLAIDGHRNDGAYVFTVTSSG